MTSQGMYSIVVGGSWNKVFVRYYTILHLLCFSGLYSTTVLSLQGRYCTVKNSDYDIYFLVTTIFFRWHSTSAMQSSVQAKRPGGEPSTMHFQQDMLRRMSLHGMHSLRLMNPTWLLRTGNISRQPVSIYINYYLPAPL